LLQPVEPVPPDASFAEHTRTFRPSAQNFAEVAVPTLEQAAADPLNDMVSRLRHVVQSAKGFHNIQDAVLAEFSEMDSTEMVKMMQLAMTLAELEGRAEVQDV
jgi:phage gp29-like protein